MNRVLQKFWLIFILDLEGRYHQLSVLSCKTGTRQEPVKQQQVETSFHQNFSQLCRCLSPAKTVQSRNFCFYSFSEQAVFSIFVDVNI